MELHLGYLTWPELLVRVGLAFLTGAVLGWEREQHGRAAGLRTTLLVCLASCVAMILSEYLYVRSGPISGGWHPDPARLGAGILTGMGFLGAGAIIREGRSVRGVTTAALLWFAAVLGLVYGSGYLVLGLVGLALGWVALHLLVVLERRIHSDWYSDLSVTVRHPGATDEEILHHLQELGLKATTAELDYDVVKGERTLTYRLELKRGDLVGLPTRVVQRLQDLPGLTQIRWH